MRPCLARDSNPLICMGIRVPQRALSLLVKGISSSREPRRQPVLTWSLHCVLQYLAFGGLTCEEKHFLQRALFLLAFATGYGASQLAAVIHYPSFSRLEEDCSALIVSPSPTFLANDERVNDMIVPSIFHPSLREDTHARCARSVYSRTTWNTQKRFLSVISSTIRSLGSPYP